MAQYFTHLHLHTEYSLLDGAITLDNLMEYCAAYHVPSIAISDHGNIFGGVKFFKRAKKSGIRPVLGIEAYITPDVAVKDNSERYYHLLLLVENATGYKNLCRLLNFAYTKGFYFKPRIDYAALREHSEGLIASTACLGGHLPQLLLKNREEEARAHIRMMQGMFGEDNFLFEIQPEQQDEQVLVNKRLIELSPEMGIPLIATADCHYYKAEHKYAHEVLLATQTKHKMTDSDRMSFGELQAHMFSPQEMLALFPGQEDAVYRTGEIADRCDFEFQFGKLFFPDFAVPQEQTSESYFRQLCTQGLQRLFDNKRIVADDPQRYWDRLELEMALITKMGFVTYFLVVSDFIMWAKGNGVPVGTGRGSAAGALVAWAMGITDIDPLRYNLLFERFLNPERVSMPDIDIDFCIFGRERVIEYVKERYGHDKVCQIITFGTMMAKGVIKDVSRALSIPFEEANALTDLVPDQLKITLTEAMEQEPRLKALAESNPTVGRMFDVSFVLEGLTRHASKHAAGIVITPEPISEMLPVYVPPKTNDLVTQYAMTELESLGFLKMDFLGLKNLTLIKRVVDLVKKNHNVEIDPAYLPLDDEKTFELFTSGDTTGVFQFEGNGIREMLRRLKPEGIEDIIAANALYRPGPLGSGMVDDFIERRHGKQKITYLFPELEPILRETYGVIVYQEQVMRIASAIGKYSLGEADILRRAMGKKKVEVMQEQRAIFMARSTDAGFDTKKAGELFDLMAYFAGYGFNKSHSAAYGVIAYQTAYLKAHYPVEFMACLISLEAGDPEKMAEYVQEARDQGIAVLAPDINLSEHDFTGVGNEIRFGLVGIKNVGETGITACLQERSKAGPFKDLLDFCIRVDLRVCNKRYIESLVAAGAFDGLPGNRAQKTNDLQRVMDCALERKEALETGQIGLFGLVNNGPEQGLDQSFAFEVCDDWPVAKKLEQEKELLGIYLSARPMDQYRQQLLWLGVQPFASAQEAAGIKFLGCGQVKSVREIMTKKGDRMAFVQLEDLSGTAELVVFPKVFSQVRDTLVTGAILLVGGELDTAARSCKIKASWAFPIDELFANRTDLIEQVLVFLPNTSLAKDTVAALPECLLPGRARLEFIFWDNGKQLCLAARQKVLCDTSAVSALGNVAENLRIKLAL
ncbi:MAG: polymerase III, alpha subunit protein [candidate division TM6 bacterium GW2011_GWF2_43_17]|nr:MAG: polymerase III, alpha subunit protein [candidate division TM6 bacterium GW2011_GWF2_43_17]